jgi:EmrB/QacA subfamily drug resistance transporter
VSEGTPSPDERSPGATPTPAPALDPTVAPTPPFIRFGTAQARWVLAATVLGSGIAFLDGTVVNVALPAIERDLDAGLSGLQWTLDGYLVTLTALIVLGGSLGDIYGRRRVFVIGLVGFSAASLLCGVAPTTAMLVAARALQGVAAALLVPGSLAILSATFHHDDRGRAVGAWSGLAGVSTAIGPFLGGWLVDAVSWRWIFLINLPLAGAAVAITLRHVPETRDEAAVHRPDLPGAASAAVGLAAVCYALIEGAGGFGAAEMAALVLGLAALGLFVYIESTTPQPMLPLSLFRSQQFSGANATTFAVYAGLGGALFLVVLQLQLVLGYSALESGTALLPITLMMLALSARIGALAQRIGPRLPMTVGPLVAAAGLALFAGIGEGDRYVTAVLPAALLFGLGLAITVAPLTAAVLAAVDERHLGVGSAVNNAVARLAGLLAVAVLPAVVGLDPAASAAEFTSAYTEAVLIAAALSVAGAGIAFLTVRRVAPVGTSVTQPSVDHPCHHPCVTETVEIPHSEAA